MAPKQQRMQQTTSVNSSDLFALPLSCAAVIGPPCNQNQNHFVYNVADKYHYCHVPLHNVPFCDVLSWYILLRNQFANSCIVAVVHHSC